ncbi:Gfo/Idh/MocA family protein [Streptomyces sp. NPDC020607]|uniref:Gfo/Idh/MocA family protein n=1 Tax=Streptomyces sp. NPDC020607 TaxID=3365082 RepID=UPI0037B5BD7D
MKIALLGTDFGQAHAAVYAARDDVEVVMFGRNPAKTAHTADTFGFVSSTDSNRAFEDDFDLVDICLPLPLHAEYALRALDADKHALVELPLAGSMEDARRVAEVAGHGDKHMFVDMFERFIPANRALSDAVHKGTYGRLEQLSLWNRTAHLWPGVSLGLKALPLEAMHSDMDIVTRLFGMPERVEVSTVARDDDSAAIEAVLGFDGALVRDSVSSLAPMAWGARTGYTATFSEGVLESVSTMGYDGRPSGAVTVYTADGGREVELEPADQYAAMIDHVLACLRDEAENEIAPASVLDALQLTLDVDRRVNGSAGRVRHLAAQGRCRLPARHARCAIRPPAQVSCREGGRASRCATRGAAWSVARTQSPLRVSRGRPSSRLNVRPGMHLVQPLARTYRAPMDGPRMRQDGVAVSARRVQGCSRRSPWRRAASSRSSPPCSLGSTATATAL